MKKENFLNLGTFWDEFAECPWTPAHRLWFAVIIEAVSDLSSRDRSVSRQARVWLFESKSGKVGSFNWVCLHVFSNPLVTRDAIRRVVRADRKAIGKRIRTMRSKKPKVRVAGSLPAGPSRLGGVVERVRGGGRFGPAD